MPVSAITDESSGHGSVAPMTKVVTDGDSVMFRFIRHVSARPCAGGVKKLLMARDGLLRPRTCSKSLE